MNTKEAYERMAKCGVVAPLVSRNEIGFYRESLDYRVTVPDKHVELMLEAAWHRKYERAIVVKCVDGFWVNDMNEQGVAWHAMTRMAAIVAHAEDMHDAACKEQPNGNA